VQSASKIPKPVFPAAGYGKSKCVSAKSIFISSGSMKKKLYGGRPHTSVAAVGEK